MGSGNFGTSLNGKVVRTRKRKLQSNSTPCPECGAGKGQPCFTNVPGRGLRNRSKTHRAEAERKRKQALAPNPPEKKPVDNGKGLGPLIRVYPKRLRLDRTPRLEEGQAYVTGDRSRYHLNWCSDVALQWSEDPQELFLIEVSTAGRRTPCGICTVTAQ